MFAKVEAALAAGVEPGSEEGRANAAEWSGLAGQFTGGNREVAKGLNSMYADQGNWPAAQSQFAIRPELMEFIRRASAPASQDATSADVPSTRMVSKKCLWRTAIPSRANPRDSRVGILVGLVNVLAPRPIVRTHRVDVPARLAGIPA